MPADHESDARARRIAEAARRARAEADARKAERRASDRPVEHSGPRGPEPTRYGDWEKKGIASDF